MVCQLIIARRDRELIVPITSLAAGPYVASLMVGTLDDIATEHMTRSIRGAAVGREGYTHP